MPRILAVDPAQASGKAKQLLDAVQAKLGITPNLMRTLAQGPAALEAYLSFSGALATGSLSAKLREQIALAVAETNTCNYCLSAHTTIGKMVGLSEADLTASRQANSADTKVDAALKFARATVAQRGLITNDDFARVRQAGYADGEIAEIIANVALNIFTNYFNHIAQTDVDFPAVKAAGAR